MNTISSQTWLSSFVNTTLSLVLSFFSLPTPGSLSKDTFLPSFSCCSKGRFSMVVIKSDPTAHCLPRSVRCLPSVCVHEKVPLALSFFICRDPELLNLHGLTAVLCLLVPLLNYTDTDLKHLKRTDCFYFLRPIPTA